MYREGPDISYKEGLQFGIKQFFADEKLKQKEDFKITDILIQKVYRIFAEEGKDKEAKEIIDEYVAERFPEYRQNKPEELTKIEGNF